MTSGPYPDCTACEAPCCRRQFMSDDNGWYSVADARPIYRAAGADIRVVGWADQEDGRRQPMLECTAFDADHLACGVYATRPEHCRIYDCRGADEYAPEWEARPHCDVDRHRKMEVLRARANGRR